MKVKFVLKGEYELTDDCLRLMGSFCLAEVIEHVIYERYVKDYARKKAEKLTSEVAKGEV